jgi:prophage antirepressor-like protein
VPFFFEGQEVRVKIDGVPHFVGRDVCSRLGYSDPTNAMKQHCKGVAKHHPLLTVGGVQSFRALDRADVLRLITSSTPPAAQEFERWVFEEVLPSIMDTGRYVQAGVMPPQIAEALETIALQNRIIVGQNERFERLEKKVDAALLGFDQTQKKVKTFYTSLQILQDQNAAKKRRSGLAVRVTSRLRRWRREHNMDDATEISSETGRYIFRRDAVRRWPADEGRNIIKAGNDKVAAPKIEAADAGTSAS